MAQFGTWPNTDTGTGRVGQALKTKYGKAQEKYLNRSNPYLGKVKVENDLDGEQNKGFIDAGYIGGAGAGNEVPSANRGFYYQPVLTSKTLQVTADIDHKARELAKTDVGSFVNGQKHTIRKLTEKYQWLRSLAHWGAGDGSLGVVDTTVTQISGDTWDFVVTAATYQLRRFQKREVINVGANSADTVYTIEAVDPTTRTVRVQRVRGNRFPLAGDKIYLQNSQGNFPTSLRNAFELSSGQSLYGITFDALDYSPTRVDAGGAVFSADMLNEGVLKMHEKSGRVPTELYLNHRGMQRLTSSIEDRKYIDTGKTTNRKGDFGYDSLVFKSVEGEIPLIIEPNLYDGELVGICSDMVIEHHTVSGPHYVTSEGGDVLHLKSGQNTYEIRWIDYLEIEASPIYTMQIYNAATS